MCVYCNKAKLKGIDTPISPHLSVAKDKNDCLIFF